MTQTTGARSTADIDRLTDDLAAGIAALATTESWQRYLGFQATLPAYSFQNTMLVLLQCPRASLVMPLGDAKAPKPGTWTAMGRTRIEGERDILIRKPAFKTIEADEAWDGKEHTIRRFVWVPILDISQTEGADVPEPVKLLDGDDPDGVLGKVVAFIERHGYAVEFVPSIDGGPANGDCTYALKRIRVATDGRTPLQQVKTAIHEAAHMLLHEGHLDRNRMELEAESVAYVVSQYVGLNTTDYSFGYVLHWMRSDPDKAQKAIKKSGTRIQEASKAILDGIGAISARTGSIASDQAALVAAA